MMYDFKKQQQIIENVIGAEKKSLFRDETGSFFQFTINRPGR